MAIHEYDTQEELDEAFERLEELQFERLSLREEVEEKHKELEWAEEELRNFEEDNKDLF